MEDQGKDQGGGKARPKIPRLYHTKSKGGCQRCRARRVKCDETRPVCKSCNRHNVPCIYDQNPAAKNIKKSTSRLGTPPTDSGAHNPNSLPPEAANFNPFGAPPLSPLPLDGDFELPESASRRMLELRLLQNYIQNVAPNFPATHDANALHSWAVEAPLLGFSHQNILYQIFSMSSLHLLFTSPSESERQTMAAARQTYHMLALRTQREAIQELSAKNADAVCFCSAMIYIEAFASLKNRNMGERGYEPPMEWLNMARGAGSVFQAALNTLSDYEGAKVMTIVRSSPFLSDLDDLFSPSNLLGFEDLLSQDEPLRRELGGWDDATRVAYEKTVAYLGSISTAFKKGEDARSIRRRLMAFAILIPKEFIGFVEEGRPRALIVLAMAMGMASKVGELWWIGRIPRREVEGVWGAVGPEWRVLLRWPLEAVGAGAGKGGNKGDDLGWDTGGGVGLCPS